MSEKISCAYCGDDGPLVHTAMACVARLRSQLAAKDAEIERLRALFQNTHGVHDSWVDAVAREKARADAATRALEKIKERHIPTYSTNFEWMRDIANDHRRTAAAALAQIEGGKK